MKILVFTACIVGDWGYLRFTPKEHFISFVGKTLIILI